MLDRATGHANDSDRSVPHLVLRLPNWALQHYKRRAEQRGVSVRTVLREVLCAAVRGEEDQ